MLRAALLALVFGSGLFAVPASLADCEVGDPTGLTSTCVGDWEYESGDPSCSSDGYHYGSTWVWTGVTHIVDVSAAGESWCNESGAWHHEGQSIRAGAAVYPVSIGLRYTEWSENGASTCIVIVAIHTPAYDIEYPKQCKAGLPAVPWGGVLPG